MQISQMIVDMKIVDFQKLLCTFYTQSFYLKIA